MDKYELFKKALANNAKLKAYNQEELITIGHIFGSEHNAFQEICKAYLTKKTSYRNDPMIGAKVEIEFNWRQEEVLVKQLDISLVFNLTTFPTFLNLIDICFSDVHPVGSVVELDIDLLPEQVKAMYADSKPLASISGRKFWFGNDFACYSDYVGRFWPFGEDHSTPLYLANVMIKRVVFTGMVDDTEEKFVAKVLRSDIIDQKSKSIVFLTDGEKEEMYQHQL